MKKEQQKNITTTPNKSKYSDNKKNSINQIKIPEKTTKLNKNI